MEPSLPAATDLVVELRTRIADHDTAQAIAASVIEHRLAACVHLRGPLESTYRWAGEVEHAPEWELDAVTTVDRAAALVAHIEHLHPYELPAVLITTAGTTPRYAAWVAEHTSP
jgi:periplasmic divalent cation tolerance protein